MINVTKLGTLGNNMWQYSVSRVIAEKNNLQLNILAQSATGHVVATLFVIVSVGYSIARRTLGLLAKWKMADGGSIEFK